jgi:hypothetical protein
MTKDEAIALAQTGWWKGRDAFEVAAFQLDEEKLCMDFGDYQEAMGKALGRPVWTHEFARPDLLRAELLKERTPPSFAEILALLPGHVEVIVIEPPEGR